MASKVYVCEKCGSRRCGEYLGLWGKDHIEKDTCGICAENGGVVYMRHIPATETKQSGVKYVCTCCGDWEGSGDIVQSHICNLCMRLPKEKREPQNFKPLPDTQLWETIINNAKRAICCINCGQYLPNGSDAYSFVFNNTDKTNIFGSKTLGIVCVNCAVNGSSINANHYVGMVDAESYGMKYDVPI